MTKSKTICVYCASSSRVASLYTEAATRLGSLIARAGMTLVTGAGCQGLMRAVEDGALDEGGKAIGVIPRFMIDAGWQHPALTELRITENMHERKQLMADLSDAVVALPGGCGTMEELLEIITWKQLGLYLKPIVILNINGFYDPLLEMLQRAIDGHFMRPEHGTIWQVATSPQEAIDLLYTTPWWDKNVRKIAAI
jgi:uncharacterized protein (TIGR00730 family)